MKLQFLYIYTWLVVFHHPSEKMMDFVIWDDDIPNWMEIHKIPWFQSPPTRDVSKIFQICPFFFRKRTKNLTSPWISARGCSAPPRCHALQGEARRGGGGRLRGGLCEGRGSRGHRLAPNLRRGAGKKAPGHRWSKNLGHFADFYSWFYLFFMA